MCAFQLFVCCVSKMSSSLTLAFSGKSPVLQANFMPEITLDADSNYSCALLDLLFLREGNIVQNKKTFTDKIKKLDVIYIKCDIISGSYINGEQSQIIHQFTTSSLHVNDPIFAEIPKYINYLPVNTKNLRSIQISIVDRTGKLIDISGIENIIGRISIKRDINGKFP